MSYKDLEIWTLMNIVDVSVILGFFALGITFIRRYLKSLEKHLTLRVSIEVWKVFWDIIIDLFLAITVVFGFMVLNPDIFADTKIAVPFMPAATVLFAIALVLRLFYGGHKIENKNFSLSLWFLIIGNIFNWFGYTFIMEAASSEYLDKHPSAFWQFLKNLRSNVNLELAQITFWIFGTLLFIVFVWAIIAALSQLKKKNNEEE